MKINALVVLYNSSLSDSMTLKSILNSDINEVELNLIIWNNGPVLLDEHDISNFLKSCKKNKINSSIFQDIRNISLSRIYNHFIYQLNYDFFVIFDQDSMIDSYFFQYIYRNNNYAMICPAVYPKQRDEKHCFPCDYELKDQVISKGKFSLSDIRTINSGTAISKQLVNILLTNHHYVFDEKFAFYHTDHRFFDLIHVTPEAATLDGLCIGRMYHDMTCEVSFKEQNQRTRLEIAYAKMLLRIYRSKNPKNEIRRNLIYAYKMKHKDNLNFRSFIMLLKCVIFKRHPRSFYNIDKNIKPTNQTCL